MSYVCMDWCFLVLCLVTEGLHVTVFKKELLIFSGIYFIETQFCSS